MKIARTTLSTLLAATILAGGLAFAPALTAQDEHEEHHGESAMQDTQEGEERGRGMMGQGQMGQGMMGQGMMGQGMMRGMQEGGEMGPGMMGHMGHMGHGMMGHGMMGKMGHGMMGMMHRGMMEDLTEEQREEMRGLRSEMRRDRMEAMLDMMDLRDEMHELMLDERPEPRRVRELHDRMAERHGDLLEAMIEHRNRMHDLVGED